ncbi:hypothetical protein [Mycobacterium sp. Aquia_213]|uniref:hypothetical protein n=1 Tax=Mycobacterium sp. Aquia_213 TaxID=2991728 RepID=UPI00226E7842|nr:hypothetical protein [Mycobacterium sp. Aquia_213]WAC93431.1 hypothetical protein LMQ14_10020 [Mycobacterium sp. Aquia_213]
MSTSAGVSKRFASAACARGAFDDVVVVDDDDDAVPPPWLPPQAATNIPVVATATATAN